MKSMKWLYLFMMLFALLVAKPAEAGQAGKNKAWYGQTPVWQVLQELGEPVPGHYIEDFDSQAVKRGEELVKQGFTIGPDGKKTKQQSKYFRCTHCHNIHKEDPDLRKSDPEARLTYVVRNHLPFLQGTTFYGVVNRQSWFNGYYQEKYKRVVQKANKDLKEAIQACAKNCALGRKFKKWELQSVLAYFWSLQLTLDDLNLSPADWQKLELAAEQPQANDDLGPWLKGFYLPAAAATLAPPPVDRKTGYSYSGDIVRGRDIFVYGCLNCHRSGGVTDEDEVFDNSEATFQMLNENMRLDSEKSIYHTIRNGVPRRLFKAYMPNYTRERMSDKQVEDLRAFIEYQAGITPLLSVRSEE